MKCPFCKEEIQEDAVKCRHCGSMLSNPAAADAPHSQADAAKSVKSLVTWGWILATAGPLLMPLFAIGGVVLGILVLVKGKGTKTGHGIGIIVTSIALGIFSISFWSAFWARF